MMTDPIADMLTRMRNAILIKAEKVDIPASRIKLEIAKLLKEEGFIRAYKILKDKKQGVLRVSLKYIDNKSIITGLKRVSKPGRRLYTGYKEVPNVMGGVGIVVLTTPKGVITDSMCRRDKVGGEVLAYVW
ncbi:30S ribosomal protein S8 [Candidatus Magnetobacterium casense]|uniref:30S ribosomal protein S8 n=1 Tax=Candidatus Magnetobacterium casense TaxID=1455061 RepID=UPI00058C212B|nr:30S ribosomal protein S8 [Candidatus Magnetobacterium casensis]